MKTIIAPTDFSSISYNACLYAARMAEDIKAELVLLHVTELPVAAMEFPVMQEVPDDISMEEELNELRDKLLAETNNTVNIQTKHIMGSVEYEIKELCNEKEPFVVVMGTHSYSLIDRFFIGSTTLYSVKHLRYPVLVIPSNFQYKPVKKIALASDMKNIYEVPANEIEAIVKYFKAELQIFYAGKDKQQISRNSLAGLLLDHRLENLQPQLHYVEDEDILKGVSSLAEKHGTDIVMIIPKKHGLFHRSQSKDFVFYSDIPVMAIHEDDVAAGV
ncbi:MAG TPA: universal stress protein [Parafilimonas sp.]|nr:universal stress protein [Parafilimonas sp.]